MNWVYINYCYSVPRFTWKNAEIFIYQFYHLFSYEKKLKFHCKVATGCFKKCNNSISRKLLNLPENIKGPFFSEIEFPAKMYSSYFHSKLISNEIIELLETLCTLISLNYLFSCFGVSIRYLNSFKNMFWPLSVDSLLLQLPN